jgi:hypothetical protein
MRSIALLLTLFVVVAPAARADDGQQMAKHKMTQSESYIMIEPMYATIMDGDRPAGMLLVAVGLDIPDPKLRADAERALPLIEDDFVRSVMSFAWTSVRLTEQPDVVALADRLQRVTDRALHRPGAKVLLAEVASRVKF